MRKILLFVVASHVSVALAQFSPGDLTRAHEEFEGMSHCADCHEVGKEISGMKCLTCHTEIKKGLDLKRGYHFVVSANNCVSCHKDHLGKDARITIVDRTRFDHTKTGFPLTGKHAAKACDDCHTTKFIRNPEIAKKPRKTSLGLNAACISCHEDKHRGLLGTDCNSCHTTSAWKPASNFDHSKTKFALVGKHRDLACNKCHTESTVESESRRSILGTKSFSDCTPCHKSAHTAKFASQTCTSCHVPTGWREVRERQFNHDVTNFKLRGKHAAVKCQQCHKVDAARGQTKLLKLPHDRCTDCHEDHHRGEFREKYSNDCSKCHNEDGFHPSTFTLVRHETSRFSLKGAHTAIPCGRCHNPSGNDRSLFHFSSLKCESCHKDQHGGQFKIMMGEVGCAKCHSSGDWKSITFDHSKTSFSLVGKHASTSCSGCHKPVGKTSVIQYKGVATNCASCHEEPHAKQFAVLGTTNCTPCHTTIAWTSLVFDHEKQSAFALTGAHKKVPCQACHKQERMGGKVVVRFKPLSTKCESCHAKKEMKNG